jgi:hypothetical protein
VAASDSQSEYRPGPRRRNAAKAAGDSTTCAARLAFFCSVPSPAPVVHSRIGRAPHTTHALPASGFSRRCGVAARGAAAASPAGDRSPGAAGPPQLMAKTLACTRASASASLRRSQAERHCIHRPSIQYFTAESPSDRFPAFSAAKYHAFDV